MSNNLVYRKGKHIKEFPYQTQTKLTRAVLSSNILDVQLALIGYQLSVDGVSSADIYRTLKDITTMVHSGYTITGI